jgi:hypothetical protein
VSASPQNAGRTRRGSPLLMQQSRKYMRDYMRKRYQRLRDSGCCTDCQRPSEKGMARCLSCSEEFNNYQKSKYGDSVRKYMRHYMRKRKNLLREADLCVVCRVPSLGRYRCSICSEKKNASRRKSKNEFCSSPKSLTGNSDASRTRSAGSVL